MVQTERICCGLRFLRRVFMSADALHMLHTQRSGRRRAYHRLNAKVHSLEDVLLEKVCEQ